VECRGRETHAIKPDGVLYLIVASMEIRPCLSQRAAK
jgi:hypothetical protein